MPDLIAVLIALAALVAAFFFVRWCRRRASARHAAPVKPKRKRRAKVKPQAKRRRKVR